MLPRGGDGRAIERAFQSKPNVSCHNFDFWKQMEAVNKIYEMFVDPARV